MGHDKFATRKITIMRHVMEVEDDRMLCALEKSLWRYRKDKAAGVYDAKYERKKKVNGLPINF